MSRLYYITIILCFFWINSCQIKDSIRDQVKIYEEKIMIPTYLLGEAESNPIFYTPRNYQGAQLRIYPYPYLNKLTEELASKEYKGLFIENKYVKICVLPELGGRLYYALDKTNQYDFVYRNRVIKPALIGMAGAWISGGVEWNIPHHHRVSTFMPVDYRLMDNPDGSKTIWVGEFEKRHQTHWVVGMTLHPDKSYIQTDIRLFNTTPYIQSFLAWANTAVHANENYQVIFPPDVERAVFHSKVEFIDFPVADQFYRGIDFRNDVDVGWWKNTTSPTSFFAWDTKMDFLGGIDHGKQAGTVLVGDHKVFIGKKFWNWGNNDVAKLWDQMLTDEDGPYLELMMGMYSDNQPDYSWNDPQAAKMGTMYYMPIRNLNSIKNANKEMAVNLELINDSLLIQLSAFSKFRNAKIELLYGDELIYEEKIDVSPDSPFEYRVAARDKSLYSEYSIQVFSNKGEKLINFRQPEPKNDPLPATYHTPESPSDMDSPDELYLAGLRLEQFGNPNLDPLKYYQEGLKYNLDNISVNTQLGIYFLKNGSISLAEKYLRKASEQVTDNYTTPKNDEPLYYLGIALFLQEKYVEARDVLERVSWRKAWKSTALFYLAVIESQMGKLENALAKAEESLKADSRNVEALCLLSTLYRNTDQYARAADVIQDLLESDPLNLWGLFEAHLLEDVKSIPEQDRITHEKLIELFRNEPDNYLEVASRYGVCGFYEDALNLLGIAEEVASKKHNNYPLIPYYQGYFYTRLNDQANAEEFFNHARDSFKMSCSPYGRFTEKVLLSAIQKNPNDPAAFYYLGNLYADSQPELAIRHWLKCLTSDQQIPSAYRNIAFLKANIFNQLDTAILCIEKAIELNPDDPLYLTEADQYYAYLNYEPSRRLQKLNFHLETARKADRSDLRRINLNNFTGNYEEAIESLKTRHFHIEEMTDINPHFEWTNAHLQKGLDLMRNGYCQMAIEAFNQISEFPRNLEIARDSRTGIANYWIARCYEKLENPDEAEKFDNRMINFETMEGWGGEKLPLIDFYSGLSLEKIGNRQAATGIYKRLLERSREMLNFKPHEALDLRSVRVRQELRNNQAEGYFIGGLAYYGLKDQKNATSFFRKALEIQPDLLDAKLFIDRKLPF